MGRKGQAVGDQELVDWDAAGKLITEECDVWHLIKRVNCYEVPEILKKLYPKWDFKLANSGGKSYIMAVRREEHGPSRVL